MTVNNGFPPGYFVIRSVASDRIIDVAADSYEDDAPIILFPSTESSLVECAEVVPPIPPYP